MLELEPPAICRLGRRPKSDARYLEAMASSIFRMGFSRKIIEKKWPDLRKSFAGFSIDRIASYSAKDVHRLMGDSRVIRNIGKIESIVDNARVIQEIRKTHKTFGRYLEGILDRNGEEGLIQDLGRRFSRLGPKTALVFLRMTGFEMSHTIRKITTG